MGNPAPLGKVLNVPIEKVRPSDDNPRKIPTSAVDIVAKSIAEFGWRQPLVVDADLVVIVGHTRLLAAQKLGLTNVPVVVADDLTPEQARAYRIADNRSGDFTSWDFTLLTEQLDELADDFADVLALADWQAITAEFDALTAAAPAGVEDPDADAGKVDDIVNYITGEFTLTVVCDSEEAVAAVTAAVINMPGVADVRHKR